MVLQKFGACWNFDEYLTFINDTLSHNNKKKTDYFISAFPFLKQYMISYC